MSEKSKKMVDNKRILITGGTGSFGETMVNKLLKDHDPKQIIIFSRDEKKQFDMRTNYKDHHKLKFIIGDTRDKAAVDKAMKNVDLVFHAAALKQVPSCELFPMEAVKTNIIGTNNVLDAVEENNVEKVVILSTDKAVYPINTMGLSKAIAEKIMFSKSIHSHSNTIFCGVRYGNVMLSRGSVIPLFIDLIKQGRPLTLTNPHMTRFLLPLPRAIDLVIFALDNAKNGDLLVRKSPAATMNDLATAVKNIFSPNHEIKNIGIREGEKIHETLVTREELLKADEKDEYYIIRNHKEISYKDYFTEGKIKSIPSEGYTSENTERLTIKQIEELLLSLEEIQNAIKDSTSLAKKTHYSPIGEE